MDNLGRNSRNVSRYRPLFMTSLLIDKLNYYANEALKSTNKQREWIVYVILLMNVIVFAVWELLVGDERER